MADISQIVLKDTEGNVIGTYDVKDTTVPHDSKTAQSGGTTLSLVTTGEKYTWNNKSDLTIGTTATTASAGNHTHGSITNGGAITGTTALASGDGIIFADSSDSSKLKRSSITFDGSTTTQCLTKKGTWENFTNNTGTVTSVKVGSSSYSPSSGVVSLPAYPTVNNATLTIANSTGATIGTFTANASANKTISIYNPSYYSATTLTTGTRCTVRAGGYIMINNTVFVDINILLNQACTSSQVIMGGFPAPKFNDVTLCGTVDGSAQETIYGFRIKNTDLYANGSRSNGGGWHIFGSYQYKGL